MSKSSGGKPPSSHSIGKKLKQCQRYKQSGKHEQHKVRGMIRNLKINPCDEACAKYLYQYVDKIGPSILGKALVAQAVEIMQWAVTESEYRKRYKEEVARNWKEKQEWRKLNAINAKTDPDGLVEADLLK